MCSPSQPSLFTFYFFWVHIWALSLRLLSFIVMKKEEVMGVLIFKGKKNGI